MAQDVKLDFTFGFQPVLSLTCLCKHMIFVTGMTIVQKLAGFMLHHLGNRNLY